MCWSEKRMAAKKCCSWVGASSISVPKFCWENKSLPDMIRRMCRKTYVPGTCVMGPKLQSPPIMILCHVEVRSVAQKVCVVVVHFGIVWQNLEAGSVCEGRNKLNLAKCSVDMNTHFNRLSRDNQSWFLVKVFSVKNTSSKSPDAWSIRLILVVFSYSNWTP